MFSKGNTICYLGAVWPTAFSSSVPPLIFGADDYTFQPGKFLCIYPFEINIAYTVSLDVSFIGLAIKIISFCYWPVYRTLCQCNPVLCQKIVTNIIREDNITKTALVVLIGFAFCWIPPFVADTIDNITGSLILPLQVYLF